MDGYKLTRHMMSDSRFAGIPVLLQASLSGTAGLHTGRTIGVDEDVPKFGAGKLAEVLSRLLMNT